MQDISPNDLLNAYSQGYFPMAKEDGEIAWFFPKIRGLLPVAHPKELQLCHGIRKDLKRHPWEIRQDTAFLSVMQACAARSETWISEKIIELYGSLHLQGHAHSLEVWLEGELVGGLYGVHLGGAFFGESMFHRASGASKVALVVLMEGLCQAGFSLLDTQWSTKHLLQFRGYEVPAHQYLKLLAFAMLEEQKWPDFTTIAPQKLLSSS